MDMFIIMIVVMAYMYTYVKLIKFIYFPTEVCSAMNILIH